MGIFTLVINHRIVHDTTSMFDMIEYIDTQEWKEFCILVIRENNIPIFTYRITREGRFWNSI